MNKYTILALSTALFFTTNVKAEVAAPTTTGGSCVPCPSATTVNISCTAGQCHAMENGFFGFVQNAPSDYKIDTKSDPKLSMSSTKGPTCTYKTNDSSLPFSISNKNLKGCIVNGEYGCKSNQFHCS